MDSLTHLIIFHRKLGCIDESATDEEQGEKVLYYYPKTSLYWQLSRINMLEGLIEFSNKFCKSDDIDIVIMEATTWVFYQCEPEIWIVIGMSNVASSIPTNPINNNSSSSSSSSSNNNTKNNHNQHNSQSPKGTGNGSGIGSGNSRRNESSGTLGFHKHVPNGKGLLVAVKVKMIILTVLISYS